MCVGRKDIDYKQPNSVLLALEEVEVGVKDGGQHRDLVLWGGVAREDDGELVRLVDEVTAALLHLDQLAFLSASLGVSHVEAVGETWVLGAEGLGAAVLEVADSEPERGASGAAAGVGAASAAAAGRELLPPKR